MALNLTTFKTNCDAVSDLIDAESDTSAHYTTMADAVKADAATVTELQRIVTACGRLLAAIGRGPNVQTGI